jgi:hypothetical protein
MESRNINLIFERISSSITSSNSLLQLETAERMVELFRRQNTYPELTEKLELVFLRKADALHYFEWKRSKDFGAAA